MKRISVFIAVVMATLLWSSASFATGASTTAQAPIVEVPTVGETPCSGEHANGLQLLKHEDGTLYAEIVCKDGKKQTARYYTRDKKQVTVVYDKGVAHTTKIIDEKGNVLVTYAHADAASAELSQGSEASPEALTHGTCALTEKLEEVSQKKKTAGVPAQQMQKQGALKKNLTQRIRAKR